MRFSLIAILFAASGAILLATSCDSTDAGKRCTLDSECASPYICSAPVPVVGTPPLPGTCRAPANEGGLCYRNADCYPNLICAFPGPVEPLSEGDCETAATADAHVELDSGAHSDAGQDSASGNDAGIE